MQIKVCICGGCKTRIVLTNKLLAMSKAIKREMVQREIEFNNDIQYIPCPHCTNLNMVKDS